ncbi:lipid phosphate phosphatase 2 isoform X2 [Prunus yedoensis var. nudiflora]|uniref:Lipid phosphate phosphatase 2 isoform X2 n=1 Tax=Prunus yedoensis var. nudiflora TaxID=2094558 RepID=A0A314XYU9_PRUYE|nr:lipid phosphate phosphatase 2 isoform X2 [Prunus yedoensis var. nudiflora]
MLRTTVIHDSLCVINYSSKRRRNIPSKTNHHIPTRGPTRLNAHVQPNRRAASSRPGKSQQIGRQLSDQFEDLTPPLNTETKMRARRNFWHCHWFLGLFIMAWRNLGSLCSFWNFRSIFQSRTTEIELGTHTIKSHGAALAKNHMHDWLILLLLVVIEVILFIIQPFHRFVGKDMMTDLRYPMKGNTVPVWAVPMYAVLLPIAIFVLFYARRKDVYDLHHSTLGLLFAVLITGVVTDAIKNAVGRPRPDFFWRCFPDGKDVYDQWGGVLCHGKDSDIKEGHKSFPSGHASWSFAGLGFLSLYLCGKIKAFDRKGHVAKLCIVLLPLLVASLVGISRDLLWLHFVTGNSFPSPYNDEGWGPYAYFKALEETRSNTHAASPVNALSVQVMGAQNVNERQRKNGDGFAAFSADRYTSIRLDEMESGER